jgi:ribosome-associated protein
MFSQEPELMSSPNDGPATPPQMPDASEGYRLAERAALLALDKKAEDVVILDLRGLSDVCDFFVLATGQADVQVKAIAAAIEAGLLKLGEKPVGTEGTSEGRWILLDYFDVVIHVMRHEAREYYQLERLWADAGVRVVTTDQLSDADIQARHPDLIASPAPRRHGDATDAP